jgi:hypothetical protein
MFYTEQQDKKSTY